MILVICANDSFRYGFKIDDTPENKKLVEAAIKESCTKAKTDCPHNAHDLSKPGDPKRGGLIPQTKAGMAWSMKNWPNLTKLDEMGWDTKFLKKSCIVKDVSFVAVVAFVW